jgi:hypothetical protein
VATLENMIDEVLINLAGYTLQQDRSTHLLQAVSTTTSTIASPTVLQLASTELGKGTVEVGEELMWVDSFDRIANTATISPYGRGYLGTTASTAAAGTRVVISPTFPRYVIKRAINDTIRAIGSSIFSVKQTTFTYNAAITTYELENLNIKNILTMHWESIGPSKEWIRVKRYDLDALPEINTWGATSQTVTIGDIITPGRTVKVVYATDPTALSTNADIFTTVTGLPESVRDVVILGAAYRLLTYLDPARAAMVSPQADETDSKRPYGSSGNATRQLFALYTQRLAEETKAQQQQYPARVHYSR